MVCNIHPTALVQGGPLPVHAGIESLLDVACGARR